MGKESLQVQIQIVQSLLRALAFLLRMWPDQVADEESLRDFLIGEDFLTCQ